jgi:hypothetical protein
MSSIKFILAITLAASLVACGGGGGDDSTSADSSAAPIVSPAEPVVAVYKSLRVTGTAFFGDEQAAFPPNTISNALFPASEAAFCLDLATTYAHLFDGYEEYGGSITLDSCSFAGNIGNMSATMHLSSLPYPIRFVALLTYE